MAFTVSVIEGTKGYRPTFGEVIEGMGKLYQDTERQFLSFNRIVPYNHNPSEVYSPRLYSIMQSSSAQIISMMASLKSFLCDDTFNSPSNTYQKDFPFYYKRLNKEEMLSVQKLAPKEDITKIITPFKFDGVIPEWWQAYNKTKHGLPSGAYECNLGNVLNSIGALTILHDISQWILLTSAHTTILDKDNWKDNDYAKEYEYKMDSIIDDDFRGHTMAERPIFRARSHIFYYLTDFTSK
jgi:hypothetical protein